MPTTSPTTQVRNALISRINTEFAAEGFTAVHDRIHPALAQNGTLIGVYPLREAPSANMVINEVEVMVQFYGYFIKDVDPAQAVDPTVIETYAERFRRSLRGAHNINSYAWYFNLMEINYLPDPTGNITRFEARVRAFCQNSELVETVG